MTQFTQSKYYIHTCDIVDPISLDILCVVIPKHVEVPLLETYNGKGDPMIHAKTFQTICSDFSYNYRLMAKFFSYTFWDRALQWYFSLPPYSNGSFQTLAKNFIQLF